MDVLTFGIYLFAMGTIIAGLPALAWGSALIVKNPDRKSRSDGTVSLGGGIAAITAGLSAFSWAPL